MLSDINILAPTITLAAGVALGYSFRALIAREEIKFYEALEQEYLKLISAIRSKAKKVEQAL